jgi:protein PhnA
MDIESLKARSGSQCELCGAANNLSAYTVGGGEGNHPADILICEKCAQQINSTSDLDGNHWRCLNNSMWSEVPAVQVMSYRMLRRLQQQGHSWAGDLLDTFYLDDDLIRWANTGGPDGHEAEEKIVHKDSNGNILQPGDTVVLIKDST